MPFEGEERTTEETSALGAEAARLAAQRIFNRTFAAWVVYSGILIAMMAIGVTSTVPEPHFASAQSAERTARTLKILLVLLFFSATIINIGVRWTAKILSARRYRRRNLRPSAKAFAVSQWMCFGVYALFAVAALYYRLKGGGDKKVFVLAITAALLAAFYFLRVPGYLLRAVFVDRDAHRRPTQTADDSPQD